MKNKNRFVKSKTYLVFLTILSVFLWILVWQLAASKANEKLLIAIPLPVETIKIFLQDVKEPFFWSCVWETIQHILIGFLSATVLGVLCGLISGSSKIFKTLTSPVVHLIRSVPVAAFVILAWLWIPSNTLPTFIAALMVFPIVWSHVESGLISVDQKVVEMAKVDGFNNFEIMVFIKLPLIHPQLRLGCITGLGIAWKAGVAAEIICNPTGCLGALLQRAKNVIEYGEVFAITLTIILLSLIFENLLKLIWKNPKYL